jgi:thiamine-phosphate pyrophosphorylase
MTTINDMAQAISTAHLDLALTIDAPSPYLSTGALTMPVTDSDVHEAALMACKTLGFIASDSACLAKAWEQMFKRTGQFNPNEWPAAPQDFGMQPWPRTSSFSECPLQLGLYSVLPSAAWVAQMAWAGVPTVQLRFKSDDVSSIKKEVCSAVKAVEGTQARLFINDHWQAAIEAGAYGVHLGQEDLELADLNAIRDSGLRLGISCHGYAEMLRADSFSPSYIALGAVFPTTLKKMKTAPQGIGRLKAYACLMKNYPLVAIGGINMDNLAEVLSSGVGSVAMVRALVEAQHPEQVATQFMTALKSTN